jgi:hypothetical protein
MPMTEVFAPHLQEDSIHIEINFQLFVVVVLCPCHECACRAKFRLNAANVNEAYCTVTGLPSDILLRGKPNHNRAIEGDVVAVELCKLCDWFVVYKESSRVRGSVAGILASAVCCVS